MNGAEIPINTLILSARDAASEQFLPPDDENDTRFLRGRIRIDCGPGLYLFWLRKKGFNMDCSSTSVSKK